jgi:cytochrome c oxidase subunit 2
VIDYASPRQDPVDDRGRSALCAAMALIASVASVTSLSACDRRPAIPIDVIDVRLVAQSTSWQASYLLPEAHGTSDLTTGREIHVPVGAEVRLALTSRDYISDFRLPELGLRDFAAPELPSEFRFRAEHTGRFELRGDELCGLPHTDASRGALVVEDSASYRRWIEQRREEAGHGRR